MKKNILIVEDEMIIALDIKKILLKNKFNVIAISDCHNLTIDIIKKNKKIDLILMDINIKGATHGIHSCNIIYQKYKIPTIFVSAHSEEDTLQMVKDSYAIGYISKPIKYHELLMLIHFNLNKNIQIKIDFEAEKIELKNNFFFNLNKKSLYSNNSEIFLTKKEKEVLHLLCKNKNNFVSYESLFTKVWQEESININKIRGLIFRMKRKIPFLEVTNSKEHGYKIE